jgi:hypothetical protein
MQPHELRMRNSVVIARVPKVLTGACAMPNISDTGATKSRPTYIRFPRRRASAVPTDVVGSEMIDGLSPRQHEAYLHPGRKNWDLHSAGWLSGLRLWRIKRSRLSEAHGNSSCALRGVVRVGRTRHRVPRAPLAKAFKR